MALDPDRAVRLAARWIFGGVRIDTGALAADLGVSRVTLHRRVGSREVLIGEALGFLSERTFERCLREWEAVADRSGQLRCLWVMERFRELVAGQAGLRKLLDDEPALAIRVLTDPRGRVQPRIVDICTRLLREDADAGHFVPLIDLPSLSYATVRLAESFLYADVLAARTPDLHAASTLIEALVKGRPRP